MKQAIIEKTNNSLKKIKTLKKSWFILLIIISILGCASNDDNEFDYEIDNEIDKDSTLTALLAKDVILNAENFPDDVFRRRISKITGVEEGDTITKEIILNTTEIDVSSDYNTWAIHNIDCIHNLIGIEYFVALTSLTCNWNYISSLDLSKNYKLESLSCYRNRLTSLDLSKNKHLLHLFCYSNKLSTLDLSKNIKLVSLLCGDNLLESLEIQSNSELTFLACENNKLKNLDVSNNPMLTTINCSENRLKYLDFTNNASLTHITCYHNLIGENEMEELIKSMPIVENGYFNVVYIYPTKHEGNVCTKAQVIAAKAKGWKVYNKLKEYEGS